MAFLTYKPSKPSQLNIDAQPVLTNRICLILNILASWIRMDQMQKNKFQRKTVLKIGKFYTLDPDPFFHIKFLIEMYPNP